jgi:phytoene dehydrogenase-like protein
MRTQSRKIVIVGGGIAGLCAGVYGRRCGYEVVVVESHNAPGGLATSWQRGDYTFENCLHWLLGSSQGSPMHARWREVFDIDRLSFVYPEEFVRLAGADGSVLRVYSCVERLQAEFLAKSPRDARAIGRLMRDIRALSRLDLLGQTAPWPRNWLALLKALPWMPMLYRYLRLSSAQYGARFQSPLLRQFFGEGDMAELSALALVASLAWRSSGDAGYPIGGSRAVIAPIVERLLGLGGQLRLGAKVEQILVEGDAATGVRLSDGTSLEADWVVSAADGHSTIYRLLGGQFRDARTDALYAHHKTFPSYVQVGLGVARDLVDLPGFVSCVLPHPLTVDPGTQLRQVAFRVFNYDPSFAPAGKTAVTCLLPTREFGYWLRLAQEHPAGYHEEKERVAQAAVTILERLAPGISNAIEVTDVATPATVIRHTGNWKGSMEGWLLTPQSGFRPLRQTLPGLRRFLMAGQWVMPGGGLPSGLMTARAAIRAACREDGLPWEFDRQLQGGAARLGPHAVS